MPWRGAVAVVLLRLGRVELAGETAHGPERRGLGHAPGLHHGQPVAVKPFEHAARDR